MTTSLFIEPLDVLFLRGNKLFGDPGSYGESLIPPWPSVASGALRSALLAHRGHDLARYGCGGIADDLELGTPRSPGTFTLTSFHLARRFDDGRFERLYPLPADLSVNKANSGELEVRRIVPFPARPTRPSLLSSSATPSLAVLPEPRRGKPQAGLWLTQPQWEAHLRGGEITSSELVRTRDLWQIDERVGVGLDPDRRRAADGQLFTTQAVALRKVEHGTARGSDEKRPFTVGFLAEVSGGKVPDKLMLRLGGDGRAALATLAEADAPPIDYDALEKAERCRLILTSPGLFAGGWKPTNVTGEGQELRFELSGVRGRLACAAVPRAEVISGFDIAARQPKPAQRAAPTGSVYWLDELDATSDALRKLAGRGLWSDPAENDLRRAEGFNRFTFAVY